MRIRHVFAVLAASAVGPVTAIGCFGSDGQTAPPDAGANYDSSAPHDASYPDTNIADVYVDVYGHDSALDAGPDIDAAEAAPPFTPATCADVLAATPTATDGNYTLYIGGDTTKPWTAYCYGMQTADAGADADAAPQPPLEYLTLTTGLQNFSEYIGTDTGGTSVITTYTRVRLDPATLIIHGDDQTFAASTGSLQHCADQGLVTSMPFGVAMSCDSMIDSPASIDLTGTPFTIPPNDFVVDSFPTEMGVITYVTDTNVTLVGGGFSGWVQPAPLQNPPYNNALVWMTVSYGPQPDGGLGDAGDGGD